MDFTNAAEGAIVVLSRYRIEWWDGKWKRGPEYPTMKAARSHLETHHKARPCRIVQVTTRIERGAVMLSRPPLTHYNDGGVPTIG